MKIGVQTNAWSNEIHFNELDRLVSEVSQAGFEGLEIGAHRLNLGTPDTFAAILAKHNVKVSGLHLGGTVYDPAEMTPLFMRLEVIATYARVIGAPHVMFSGKHKEGKSEAEMLMQATMLNKAGEIAKKQGLQLLYHNHFWEINNNCKELRILVNNTDPSLVSLILDLGWVHRGGGVLKDVVSEFLPRIGAFHFKDQIDNEHWTEVGNGVVDFASVMPIIKSAGKDFWCNNERDETMADALTSSTKSRMGMRKLGL